MRPTSSALVVVPLGAGLLGLWAYLRGHRSGFFVALGLGTFAILQQIAWAQRAGLPHLYLGYWISGHRKMDYKRRFRPLEAYDGRRWHEFDEALDGI